MRDTVARIWGSMTPGEMRAPAGGLFMARSGAVVGWRTGAPPLADVLWALGRLPRFAGATDRFYTVLQHSWLVFKLTHGHATADRRVALLHDAGEMLTGDIPTPMKPPGLGRLEKQFVRRLARSLGIRPVSFDAAWELAKRADTLAFRLEAESLTKWKPEPGAEPLRAKEVAIFESVLDVCHHPDGPKRGGQLHARVERALIGRVSGDLDIF